MNNKPHYWTKERIDEAFDLILKEMVEDKQSLRAILRKERDMKLPHAPLFRDWINASEERRNRYIQAMEERGEAIFEELLEIADDNSKDTYRDSEGNIKVDIEHVQRTRLRLDTRKWYLEKMLPKKYGNNSKVELSGGLEIKPPSQYIIKKAEDSESEDDRD